MTQHLLKSSRYRDLTTYEIAEMTEEEVFWFFVDMRWGARHKIICPHCGAIDKHFFRKTRKQWRCKHCDGYFSLMHSTIFENTKLRLKKILMGLTIFITTPYSISKHTLSNTLNVQTKTAHVFIGKLREVLYGMRPQRKLSGLIQIDGGHFGGRPRHGRIRRKHEPSDIAKHTEWMLTRKGKRPSMQPPATGRANWARKQKNRRVVMVLREVDSTPGIGGVRTVIAINKTENESCAVGLVKKYVEPGSTIMTDENKAYFSFEKLGYKHLTVEHAVEFSTHDGVNDNHAESYFSRLRHYALSIGKRIEPKYLADIAVEMAWREDVRRNTLKEKMEILLGGIFNHGRSLWWTGYWQGHHRLEELSFII